MLEVVLAVATLLGGIAAVWFFWDKIAAPLAPQTTLRLNFDAVRRGVLYCRITNNLPVELHKLRQFMIEHGLVESSPSCREFFARWLTHQLVVDGRAALNAFRPDEIDELQKELVALAP